VPELDKKMMNLTLHVQKQAEVDLVDTNTGLELERSPQGVFVNTGQDGLEKAAAEVIEKLSVFKYEHILVGGSTGLVAKLVKHICDTGLEIALYEFENDKKRDPSTGKMKFNPVGIRKII